MAQNHKPKSWAEDCNTYRTVRGSQSFSTVNDASASRRFPRTDLCPFGATSDSRYAYDDNPLLHGRKGDHASLQLRNSKHGWGDITLLKQGLEPGTSARVETPPAKSGRARCALSDGASGSLSGVLQQQASSQPDSWMGHPLIDPSKSKRAMLPPQDPKGRRDLFDVIHARNPGKPADDSWLGHRLLDPAKGKAHALGPEQLRGRPDLTHIMGQTILRDPNRTVLLEKGADPLSDQWCGHTLIDPNKGRLPVQSSAAEIMLGATFKPPVAPDHTDFPRPGKMHVDSKGIQSTMQGVLTGTAPDDEPRTGRIASPGIPGQRVDGRTDLYAHMAFRPLNDKETTHYGPAWDDGTVRRRRYMGPPGAVHPTKGPEMLTWQPNQRSASYVPFGKLMQEQKAMVHASDKAVKAETMQASMRSLSVS